MKIFIYFGLICAGASCLATFTIGIENLNYQLISISAIGFITLCTQIWRS